MSIATGGTSSGGARDQAPIIGISGAGVVGRAVGRVLHLLGHRIAWYDTSPGAALRASRTSGGIVVDDQRALEVADVVVLCGPGPHVALAATLLSNGCDVVSTGDAHDDVLGLLELGGAATSANARLVVGAALCPGLTGLLANHLVDQLAWTDEIHVAVHGTGGPACARQHHDALGGRARSWHDGEWVERPSGSGRELCWFPEPIGPADCYRADLADPVILHRSFPQASRVSARVSATRRDRLTSRLPMLTPPHGAGDRGAVRVEIRGASADGARETAILGAVGRTGDLAGTVAAVFAASCLDGSSPVGVSAPGDDPVLAGRMLREVVALGLQLHEYTGVARGGF
jgi:predicted dinucleotide-binding enzyme